MTFTQAKQRESGGANHRDRGWNPKSLGNIPAIITPRSA